MPYISQSARAAMAIPGSYPRNVGELTYCLTKVLLNRALSGSIEKVCEALLSEISRYLQHQDNIDFSVLCGIMGALDCTSREYARRRPHTGRHMGLARVANEFYDETIAFYEDIKMQENGDVY